MRRGWGARLTILFIEKSTDDDDEVERVRLHPRLVLRVQRRHHAANQAVRGSATFHRVFASQGRGLEVLEMARNLSPNGT